MPEEETAATLKRLEDKIDWQSKYLNQLYVYLCASGGPMAGSPAPMPLDRYPEPAKIGGTGEQFLPNSYGYRE
jgi:hypothetical protein